MSLQTSIQTGGTNSHATTSEEANALATDINAPGVIGAITNTSGVAPATGGFSANAQGTPDMTVAVAAGVCYVTATPSAGNSQLFRVKNSASANVTIAANATGGTRFDWLYLQLAAATLANPNSAGTDAATLVTSRSTSATTDNGTPPTYGTLLAVITVANGASSIANGNIADKRVRTGFKGNWIDENGNEVAKSTATASAVNEVTVTNAATANAPQIAASGDDTNVALKVVGKGTAGVYIKPKEGIVASSANAVSFNTTPADIAGATVTLTPEVAAVCIVYGFASILVNGNVGLVTCVVDGVTQTGQLRAQNPAANNVVFPGFMVWRFTLTAASHTIKLQAAASSTTITINAFGNTNDTGFYYTLLSQ